MEAAYLKAAFPIRRKVLGQNLEPFSIGHAYLLARRGNAFSIGSEGTPDFDHLVDAVYICSHTFTEAKKALASPFIIWKVLLWSKFCGKFDKDEEILKFMDYIRDGCTFPQLWSKEDGESLGAPFLQFLKVFHMINFGTSESEIMNKPYGLAVWDMCACSEMKGSASMVSEDDLEMIEEARKAKAVSK